LKKRLLIIVIILFILSGFSILYMVYNTNLPRYLSQSHKVDANVMIIEGWLPDAVIGIAGEEAQNGNYDLIVTAGVQASELEFCQVAMNGFLIFYPEFQGPRKENLPDHTIEVTAHSEMGGIYKAHFNFYVNDSLIDDFNADEFPSSFAINWHGSLDEIDSIAIQFTNDMVDVGGDRNLYVKEIIIDKEIVIPYQYNSVYDAGAIGGKNRTVNDYVSHPQIIRNKLISVGIDSSAIVAVTGKRTTINRTLASALAVRKWLKTSELNIKGVNVLSMGIHSRRTWLTYRRVLKGSFDTGIISLAVPGNTGNTNPENNRTLNEVLGLVYYQIILFPYIFI